MSSWKQNQPPGLHKNRWLSALESLILTGFVLLALPVSQWIGEINAPDPPDIDSGDTLVSPKMEEQIQQEETPEPPDIEELKIDPPPVTIEQLEVLLTPNLSGMGGTSVQVFIPGETIGDEDFVILQDLTRPPSVVRQVKPVYPAECKLLGLQGEVYLMFKVRPDGTTSEHKVLESTHPAFAQAAIRSVRKWEFRPGEKDGRVVTTRVRIRIPFTMD